jgi:hypothetical protein
MSQEKREDSPVSSRILIVEYIMSNVAEIAEYLREVMRGIGQYCAYWAL